MLEITSTYSEDENVVELKLNGRLDVMAARDAEAAFAEACEQADNIVLDMSGLEYIASAGLRTLKHLRSVVKEKDGTLVLHDVQDEIMDVFEMTGFVAMLTIE